MSKNVKSNWLGIIKGICLLIFFHVLAIGFIYILGFYLPEILGRDPYFTFAVWGVGAMGFLFWQLIYVIPLIILLRRKRNIGMMKGVIIGAVLTALLNGTCFLVFLST